MENKEITWETIAEQMEKGWLVAPTIANKITGKPFADYRIGEGKQIHEDVIKVMRISVENKMGLVIFK